MSTAPPSGLMSPAGDFVKLPSLLQLSSITSSFSGKLPSFQQLVQSISNAGSGTGAGTGGTTPTLPKSHTLNLDELPPMDVDEVVADNDRVAGLETNYTNNNTPRNTMNNTNTNASANSATIHNPHDLLTRLTTTPEQARQSLQLNSMSSVFTMGPSVFNQEIFAETIKMLNQNGEIRSGQGPNLVFHETTLWELRGLMKNIHNDEMLHRVNQYYTIYLERSKGVKKRGFKIDE